MQNILTRRRFLAATGGTVAALSYPAILRASAPKMERISLKTLNPDRGAYLGWPTIGRTAAGELLVVCSGGREEHVCPFGQVWLYRSQDNDLIFARSSLPQNIRQTIHSLQ